MRPLATQRSDDWSIGEAPLGVLGDGVDGRAALTRAQQAQLRQALRREDVRRRIAEAEALLRELGASVGGENR